MTTDITKVISVTQSAARAHYLVLSRANGSGIL